jgi:hypothetical protein
MRQWQWMIVALIVGGVAAFLRGSVGQPLFTSYGECIEGQGVFEEALLTKMGGEFRFRGAKVHAARNPIDGTPIHIVRGMYWDGRLDDGSTPIWRPAFFVASVPYQPQLDITQLGAPAKAFIALPRPTVIDFLEALKKTRGVGYRHAWWNSYPRQTWFTACFIGIGLIWPVVLNLLLFGRLTHPPIPKEKVISAHPSTPTPARPPGTLTDAESAQLAALTSNLESHPQIAPELNVDIAPPNASAPVTQLSNQPVGRSVATVLDPESKEFGADPDDFYPTERKHHHDS